MTYPVHVEGVLHSLPSSDWIRRQIYDSFKKRAEQIVLVRSGLNDTYRIIDQCDEVYFLRLSPAGWTDLGMLNEEVEAIEVLRSSTSLRLAEFSLSADGVPWAAWVLPEGKRYAVMTTHLEGAHWSAQLGFSWETVGQILAVIHRAWDFKEFLAPQRSYRFQTAQLARQISAGVDDYARELGWDRAQVGQMLRDVLETERDLESNGASWGCCHGDLSPGNIVCLSGEFPGLLDFEFCSSSLRVRDFAVLFFRVLQLSGEAVALEGIGKLCEIYRSECHFSSEEKRAIPKFAALLRLWQGLLCFSNRNRWGEEHVGVFVSGADRAAKYIFNCEIL